MSIVDCPREHEVVRVVLMKHWPDGCDDEMRRHVGTCGCCQEVVTVAAMLGAQGREDIQHARVPAAGQVWWRAAVRAHAEATRTVVQPMIWLQGIAGACALGLAITLVGLAWPALRDLGGQAGTLAATAAQQSLLVMIALAAFLLLTPLLLYVALSDE